MHDIMSVICTNIAARVVVVKVAVDRSRRVATAVLRVCAAALTCRGSKNIVNLFARTPCYLRLWREFARFLLRRFLHARACLSVLLRKPDGDSLRLVRENAPPRQALPAGAMGKALQHFPLFAPCRGIR